MNIYLDDLRPTPKGFDRVYDYEEFIKFISKNGYSKTSGKTWKKGR